LEDGLLPVQSNSHSLNSGILDGAEQASSVLLELTRQLIFELRPRTGRSIKLYLDNSLDHDLGLDSLSRMELVVRIERTFGVSLTDRALAGAETLRDLLSALQTAKRTDLSMPPTSLPESLPEPEGWDPAEASTLVEALDWHASLHPEQIQIICLEEATEERISYENLRQQALAIAAGLQALGLEPGQTVAIMLPTSNEYFSTYFGILFAGGVPVPIYPPARLSQIEDHVRRHAGILSNALVSILVTVPEARPVARLLEARVGGLRRVVTASELGNAGGEPTRITVRGSDIAFLQYTSGSTGNPKGVVLTHANLLANIRAISKAVDFARDDVFVSWLPLYHDMGLISTWLTSLYFGNPFVVMSPLGFLARPERWLWAIHRYRGTLSAAPNFAYELCVKRIEDRQIQGLDLSSWRVAANGAEPVLPETINRFTDRFAPYGFRPETMTPVYGLAESTVGLLCPPLNRKPLIDCIRRQPFVSFGKATPAEEEDSNPLRFVACGRPLPGHDVRIVDSAGREVGERVEGTMEFRGPSATSGYYRNPEDTRRLMNGEWLDTGDRAYMAEGEVYITGRVKDIIIRGGRNIYPHEVESAVGQVPGVRKGCVAVFGTRDPGSGTERLVIMAETRLLTAPEQDALREGISRLTVDILGEPADEVVLAPPHTVLKTSSGKIRRTASRDLYEKGMAGSGARAVQWQMIRLVLGSTLLQGRRWLGRMSHILYGAYSWLVFALVTSLTFLLTVAAMRPERARRVAHRGARLLLKLLGIACTVHGLEDLPHGRSCVLAANHASYLDGIIVLAAIPFDFSFVAKRELREHPLSRILLKGLGVQYVERFAMRQSVEDASRLTGTVGAGHSLFFFPEGTFVRTSGLRPFHLGAFVAAATASVPVVPVSLRGMRSLMRDGQWIPSRRAIVVTIGKPIEPQADAPDTFAAAIRLRDLARAEILRHCGEEDAGQGE
jgi:1-acyl-sn-glycerol-3-phosphate acyltransferase